MRNKVLVGLFLQGVALSIGCGAEPLPPLPPPPPPPPPVTVAPPPPPADPPLPPPKKSLAELQQAAGKGLAEAFAAGDAKKAASFYAEAAVIKVPGMPDATGRAGIEKALAQHFASFSHIKMGELRVFSKGEVVITEWVLNATHSGEFMGIKASGKPVGWAGASVVRFNEDGTIQEEHTYWNAAVVASQVGATKEKNRAVPALPTGAPQVITAQGTKEEEHNIATLALINQTWEAKDEKKWLTMLTDEASWDDLTMLEPAKGKVAVQKYFKMLSVAFPDAKTTTEASWGMGDWVIEEGTYAGTNKGLYMGARPTRRPVVIHELNLVQLDSSDKIVRAITYGNDMEMNAQLSPPKAAPRAAPIPAAKPAPAKPAAKPAPKK
ncbi:MAG: ester cyclase [Myxococcales bacterium]|nr:ester cyclase [Myxococcales bacterium]MBL0196618.1 ester cyclase [Myxococcales bacterium]